MEDNKTEEVYLGGGCFWGVEEAFRTLDGVIRTEVGYMGGHTENPTYEDVCYRNTGHAEVVHVTFDPSIITLDKILELFFSVHNPTTLNRQGPDIGDQYRSIILFTNEGQKQIAENKISEIEASQKWKDKIVTELTEAGTFYRAEEYHQQYATKHEGFVCHF